MAYIFDPIRNTFVDDEDTSLGNKLALNDTSEEIIRQIDEQFGPGTVFPASELPPKENPYKDFEDRNPAANGGMMRQNYENGAEVMTLNPLFPTRDIDSQDFQPIDVPGAIIPPLAIGAGAKRLSDIFFNKDKDESKELETIEDKKDPNIKPPKIPETSELVEELLTLKEIKDTFDKSKKFYDQKKMSKVVELTDEKFAKNLANFIDTKYQGNVNAAAKDILGVKEKTKEVENLRVRINSLFTNRGIDRGKRIGNIAPSFLDFKTDTPKTSWSDFTTKVSQDSSYIKNLTKPLIKNKIIDKSQYLPLKDLEKIFSIDHGGSKSARNNMNFIIKNLSKDGSIRKTQSGKFASYHLGDVMKAFQLKYGDGGKKIYGVVKKGTAKRYKEMKSFDKGLYDLIGNFQNTFANAAKIENLTTDKNKIIDKATPDHSHAEPRSTMLKFPNVFKNSNIKTFQTITLTDPIFNQEILSKGGFESKKIKIYKILNNYIGKKVTPEIQEILTEQKTKLNNVNNEILVAAKEAGLEGIEETFVPIDINVPNVGEKFRSENIFGDTSNKNIMGNVDEINPNAKVYDDLSKEEKIIYRENLTNEYIDYYKDFYERLDFDEDDITSYIDRVLEGDPAGKTLPISERKISKADGGPIELSPMPRVNFNGGGAVGADDDFAKELEYFLLNPDAELPKADSYRETMNPVSLLNDMIDPRNYAYYADRLAETGIRIGEFGARVLPALGQLTADLIRKPAFKVTGGTGQGYVQDYTDVMPSNIKGTGIFTEFLDNLVGSEGTKVITEKIGLTDLIKSEEQKQKDRRSTIGPKVLADQVTLGAELTAPIFPGLKLLKAYAKNRKLPVNDETKQVMEKEIDEVLSTQNLNRRDFLKTTGAGGAVILAKMLGFGDELATTTKVAEKAIKETATTGGVPPYFLNLVKKIKTMGDETMATKDKATAYKYDDYYMEEDFAGNIEITRKGDMDDMYSGYEEVYMSYRVDEVPIKGEKGSRKVEEYEEYTARPDEDGKMKDVEDGVPDDVIEEGTMFEDNIAEFGK